MQHDGRVTFAPVDVGFVMFFYGHGEYVLRPLLHAAFREYCFGHFRRRFCSTTSSARPLCNLKEG